MKYNYIDKCEAINGIGFGVSLYTQGCPYHCPGCFNPETWDFNKGKDWTKDNENYIIKLLEPTQMRRLTILGGEPLIERNIKPLEHLCKRIKELYPDKQIWLYTGGDFESKSKKYYNLIKYVDVLIDGRFKLELRDITLKWKGSSNQRVINVHKSLEHKEVILYE